MLSLCCVISGWNMIKQSIMTVSQRSRLSCFSWSLHGDVHSSFDCVWNRVSVQSSSDTVLIRTGRKKNCYQFAAKTGTASWKYFQKNYSAEKNWSLFMFMVSNNFSLILSVDRIWQQQFYQSNAVRNKISFRTDIFVFTHNDSGFIFV